MIHKILLPTDGSAQAEPTIRYALELAASLHAEIIVMYAFDPAKPLRKGSNLLADNLRQSLQQEAREIAQEIGERLRAGGLTVNALAVEGNPVEAILSAIQTETPDLVVMGIRGKPRLTGLFTHRVTDLVLRHSPIPVLIVK